METEARSKAVCRARLVQREDNNNAIVALSGVPKRGCKPRQNTAQLPAVPRVCMSSLVKRGGLSSKVVLELPSFSGLDTVLRRRMSRHVLVPMAARRDWPCDNGLRKANEFA